jgi:zinc transport system permease protein
MLDAFIKFEFLQNALIAGLLVGFLAPLLGVFIVVRRQALIADALAHVTLSGIAASLLIGKHIAFWQNISPVYFGIAFSVAGALFIETIRDVYTQYKELSIAIILSAGIGAGVIFISLANGFNTDLFNYLFGSVIAITKGDVSIIFSITFIVLLVVVLFYKEFVLVSFDEEQAAVSGLKYKLINFIFISMVAIVIAISMRIVGIILVSSLMVLPVAASLKLSRSFKQTIVTSIIFGEIATIGGLVSAYHLDIAPGGSIVMIAVMIFIFTILWRKIKTTTKSGC